MRDWQGNEIKDGDVILHIRTKPYFGMTSGGWIMPLDKNGERKIINVELPKYEDTGNYWKEGKEYKVTGVDDTLFYHFTDSEGFTYYQVLETIHMFGDYEDSLLAIRGKSDKKELYYK